MKIRYYLVLIFLVIGSSVLAQDGVACSGLIKRIDYNINLNLSYRSLSRGIGLEPGMPCDSGVLDKAVSTLLERKIFTQVTYTLIKAEDGVIVSFNMVPHTVLSEIEFFGVSELKTKDIRRAILVRSGDTLEEDSAEIARTRVLEFYRDQGYLNSEVRVEKRIEETLPLVSFVFHVVEGEVSRVKRVEFRGENLENIKEELESIKSRTIGSSLSKYFRRKLKQDAYQVLRDSGFYQSKIRIILEGDLVIFEIKPKLKIEFALSGNGSIGSSTLLSSLKLNSRLVPLRANLLGSICEDIKRLYRESAFMDATVNCSEEVVNTTDVLKVHIEEGKRYKILDPEITGAKGVSSSKLRGIVKPSSVGIFALPSAPTEESMNFDAGNLVAYYKEHGYYGVEIVQDLQINHEALTIQARYHVQERDVLKIDNLICRVEGAEDREILQDLCNDLLASYKGELFRDSFVQPLGEEIQKSVIAKGFPNAISSIVFNSESSALDVHISQGQKINVGRIICSGNYFTQDFLILREMILKEGDAWDSSKLEDSKQVLFGLGIFSSVQVSPADGSLDSPIEDLLVQVREKETGIMQGLFELSSQDGLHLQTQVAQRNLFGSGRAVILGVDGYFKQGFTDFDAARTRLGYASPKIFDTGLDYSIEGFFQTALNLNRTFKLDKEGLTQSLRYPLLKSLRLNLSQTIYNERAYEVRRDLVLGPRDLGTTTYSGIRGSFELDKRDDPFITTKGFRLELGGGILPEALGSETGLVEGHFDTSSVIPVSTNNAYAIHFRGGLIEPLNDEVVPLGSRYFIGGRDTLRGFSRYQVGPRSSGGLVVGGDTLVVLSQELRHSLQDGITVLGFLDIGQAMLRNDGGFGGDSKFGIDGLRYSPGLGMQYGTPIGPLTAEVGLATDREFGERWGRFIISIGNAF